MRERVSGWSPVLRFSPSKVKMAKSSVSISERMSASRSLSEDSVGWLCQLTFRTGIIGNMDGWSVAFEVCCFFVDF